MGQWKIRSPYYVLHFCLQLFSNDTRSLSSRRHIWQTDFVKFEEGMTQDEIDAHTDFAMRLMAACYQRWFFTTRDG